MIDRAQMLKGLLDGCILEIIARGPSYGYQITMDLNAAGFTELHEGSVYPVLIRLHKKGYLISQMRKSDLGPKRKYFEITEEGRTYLAAFKSLWSEISETVEMIMKGGRNE